MRGTEKRESLKLYTAGFRDDLAKLVRTGLVDGSRKVAVRISLSADMKMALLLLGLPAANGRTLFFFSLHSHPYSLACS